MTNAVPLIRRGGAHAVRAAPRSLVSVRSLHATRAMQDVPRSPFQVFVQTLREELQKSREMQDNMKQLQGHSDKIQDSETMRKAREAYERARIISSIKHNPRLQAAAEQLRKSGGQVGGAIAATLKQMEESEIMRSLSAMSDRVRRQLEESTAPVRNTEVYKAFAQTISEAFDDGSGAIDIRVAEGTSESEARRLRREARLRKIGRPPPVHDVEAAPAPAAEVDPIVAAAAAAGEAAGREGTDAEGAAPDAEAAPEAAKEAAAPKPKRLGGYAVGHRRTAENVNAGADLVLAPESAQPSRWNPFGEGSAVRRRLSEWNEQYQESEHPFVERLRGVTNTVASWFEENETVQVVRAIKQLDPSFTLAQFSTDLREYVIPEVLDAFHAGQRQLLRQWCGDATYNVLMATIDPYLQRGYLPQGRTLDLSNVEVLQGKMLETGPMPVLVISFQTQELMYFTDPRTGEVKEGSIEQANLCRYAMVLTRVESELDNEITGGWKIVELARRGEAAFM
ncbi:protein translocase subunit [Malassezia brasiliensis]|uniref:Mitochondrial import inner membrane translocase subunit TIM44 n=1 Tax=Malassezia brasiliensis TaxID=1821822 RepID=A0AAF0IP93_9BASI|nr:protein translocase subunit [Malassezia brasiliensis]